MRTRNDGPAHLPALALPARLAAFICVAALVTPLAAQTVADPIGAGRPIVRNYDHRHFGAEVQNWDVLQAGSGTTFVVRLPVGRGHFRAEEIAAALPVPQSANGPEPAAFAPLALVPAGMREQRPETTVCCMVKPFEPRELLAQIRNLLEQRRLLRHRFSGTVVLKPSEMAVVSADEAFLGRILAAVEAHLEDPEFDVEQLGQAVGLSRSQLHRKVRSLTHQPPTILIRSIRLQRSAALLAGRAGSVAEIAYSVGFSSQSYFAKCFREQFGCSPKEYCEARHSSGDGSPTVHG